MRAGRWAVTVAVAGALLLSGCGGDDNSAGVELGGAPTSAEPTSTPTPSATPTDDGPIAEEPEDGVFTRGRSKAKDDDERAVEEVWFAYWTELLRMYSTGEVDRDALYALATDSAASNALDYAAGLADAGHRQTGGAIGSVTKVKVVGDTATIQGCFRNSTVDVDAQGTPVEEPDPFFTTKDTLVREGPDWRVSEQTTSAGITPCDYR